MIGLTSAANALLETVLQSTVVPPPPSLLLLHDIPVAIKEMKIAEMKILFMIAGFC
jgi:hypothetical protein